MAFVSLWLGTAVAGFTVAFNYQSTSGHAGAVPNHLSEPAVLSPETSRDTLIMFAHPQCPCTRASMEEFNRVLARVHDRVNATVYFYKPSIFSNDWSKSSLWRSAAAIPGVTVREDIDGKLAKSFGAETSGHVLLYGTDGQLLFSGGITGSRGHAGDNAGEDAIVSLCEGGSLATNMTAVYGCSLLSQGESGTNEITANK